MPISQRMESSLKSLANTQSWKVEGLTLFEWLQSHQLSLPQNGLSKLIGTPKYALLPWGFWRKASEGNVETTRLYVSRAVREQYLLPTSQSGSPWVTKLNNYPQIFPLGGKGKRGGEQEENSERFLWQEARISCQDISDTPLAGVTTHLGEEKLPSTAQTQNIPQGRRGHSHWWVDPKLALRI